MTQLKPLHLAIGLLLISVNAELLAGQIFRYQDESGVTTMSKVLPPYAAKNGYEVLDDRTFRLIEKVRPELSVEQIVEEEKCLESEREAIRQAKLAEKERLEKIRQQEIYDNNLRASYGSEQDLLNTKDVDIGNLNNLLAKTKTHKDKNEQGLRKLEQQAAEAELAGRKISKNQQKRINTMQAEIANSEMEIERLGKEIEERAKQFDQDLQRLRELLAKN